MHEAAPVSLLQRRIAFLGVLLLVVGFFTGIWSAAALNRSIPVALPHLALAAHLNGVLGGLELLALGFSIPMLRLSPNALLWLAGMLGLSTWANWFVTLVASFWGVTGLSYNADPKNNAVAFCLQILVVVPSLLGGGLWLVGFLKKPTI